MKPGDRPGAVDGITVHEHGGVTIVGAGLEYMSLCALRGAVKLEAQGLRHSRGSMTAAAKRRYGLKGNRDKVLAGLDALIAAHVAAHPPKKD